MSCCPGVQAVTCLGLVLLVYGPGQTYRSRAVRGAAPGKQQLDDVQVVVMDGHMQGSQAILQGAGGRPTNRTAFTHVIFY